MENYLNFGNYYNYVTQHEYNTRGVRFRHPNIVCEFERRALSYQLILMLDNLPSYFWRQILRPRLDILNELF